MTRNWFARIVVLSILALLAGCAGRNFVRPDAKTLPLGSMTKGQLLERFGKPYQTGTIMMNGKSMEKLSYAYASGAASAVGGVTPGRSMNYYLFNDRLVGYEFMSSFPEDNTDFDEVKVAQINKGKTTVGEAIRLMDKPYGYHSFPMTERPDLKALAYAYVRLKGTVFNLSFYQKSLVVTYGADGIVTDVKLSTSGEK